jgi:hypothetical protein
MNLGSEDRLAMLQADAIKSDTGRTCYFAAKYTVYMRLRKNCEKRWLASSCVPVRTEQLGFNWGDFH